MKLKERDENWKQLVCFYKSLADKCFIRGDYESSWNFSAIVMDIVELEKQTVKKIIYGEPWVENINWKSQTKIINKDIAL